MEQQAPRYRRLDLINSMKHGGLIEDTIATWVNLPRLHFSKI